MRLTAKAVEKLRHEGERHFRDIKDEGTPGLYLRLLAGGGKRWVLRYKVAGRVHVGTLGDAAEIGLATAREKAHQWRAIIRQGRDPAGEERQQAVAERRTPTVAAFIDEYIERRAKPNMRGWREEERLLRHDALPAIGAMRLDIVQRRDIAPMIDAIRDRGAPVVANRVAELTRRMFKFAVERGVISSNPATGIKASRETPRARVLSDGELCRLWNLTAPGSERIEASTRLALRLMLLTGARSNEVCGASWSEINADKAEWVIPSTRTKNGREHILPLSGPAMDAIHEAAMARRNEWLLPGRLDHHVTASGCWQAIKRILGDEVTVHDLRRTLATGLQQLGIRLEVTESVLNHISGTRAGVVGIYQRHDWQTEKRAALDAWGRHVLAIASCGASTGCPRKDRGD